MIFTLNFILFQKGIPKGIQTDDGVLQNSESLIKDVLKDGQNVWVLLKDDEISEKVSKEVLEEVLNQ